MESNHRSHARLLSNDSVVLFIFFDLLFLPRLVPLFGIPVSLLAVLAYAAGRGVAGKKLLTIALILAICLLSAFNGISAKGAFYFADDIKRGLQLASSLLYGAILLRANRSCFDKLAKVLRLFFVYTLLLAILSYVYPSAYEQFIREVYPEAISELEDNLGAMRFGYFFTDPNSAGYFVCFALAFYITLENRRRLALPLLFASAVILSTQSRGALIALAIIYLHIVANSQITILNKLSIVGIVGLAITVILFQFGELATLAVELFEYRAQAEETLGLGVGGGRLDKYSYFLNNINLLPFGIGYSLQQNGFEFRPHSDLIRINFAYGLPLLLPLMYLVYPRTTGLRNIFAVFMIPFLVNTVIDDYKLLPLYLLIINVGRFASVKARRPYGRWN